MTSSRALNTSSPDDSAPSVSTTSAEKMSPQPNAPHADTDKPPKIEYHRLKRIARHERLRYYRPGGYHPIDIGDKLGEHGSGRFVVMRKLGYGTYGTVWMCWDQKDKKLRAVKVMQADQSEDNYDSEVGLLDRLSEAGGQVSVEDAYEKHLAVPLEHFWQDGPNGRHLCIVMPILGPNVQKAKALGGVDFLKDVCSQITVGLAFLHRKEMAHGDLHFGNVLIQTTLSDVSDIKPLKTSDTEPLVAKGSGVSGSHAPDYICECVHWMEYDPKYFKKEIAIIDFGTSFKASDPPDYQTINTSLRAPENFFGAFPSQASDLWALGCTMMCILGSRNPFQETPEEEDWLPSVQSVQDWEDILGPLPQPYRAKWIAHMRRKENRKYNEMDDSQPVSVTPEQLAFWKRLRLMDFGSEDAIFECLAWPTPLPVPASGQQQKQQDKAKAGEDSGSGKRKEWSLPREELDSAVSLVRSLFKYEPSDRTPASELLAHPFITKYTPFPPLPRQDQPSSQSSRDALDEQDLPVRGGGAVDARDADAAEEEEADLGGKLGDRVQQAPRQPRGEEAVVEPLVGGEDLGLRGGLGGVAERAHAGLLVPEEHLQHEDVAVQAGDGGCGCCSEDTHGWTGIVRSR